MKAAFAVIAALWIASASQPALADCGDLTKRLLNVEVAGARTYLGNLPSGVRMARQQDMGGSGMDTLTGKALNLDIQSAGVYYHKDRVYMVLARVHGRSESEIEQVLGTLLSIANTDFDPNPKLVPKGQYLRCGDGLVAQIVRGQIVHSKEKQIPILVLNIRHPKMKLRFECELHPERCRNLPKGYLD